MSSALIVGFGAAICEVAGMSAGGVVAGLLVEDK
jgi:hypothetical protein